MVVSRVPIDFGIVDVSIGETDDVFGIVNAVLSRRHFHGLMPRPTEESRHIGQKKSSDRIFDGSLFLAKNAGEGSLV